MKGLGFSQNGDFDNAGYLMLEKDGIEIHFFLFSGLNPAENYSQVYIRTEAIDDWYRYLTENGIAIHPNGHLSDKPWGQREFSLLDPDNNLLTFGQPSWLSAFLTFI
jgi:uncharacterized glyoxalase superfamily protein PhnB